MSVVLRTNQITGVSVVVNATDGASKSYADSASSGGTPSITGNENEFLTTDGSNTSWEPIQGYQEYTTAGNYTFNIPTHAKEFFIEATGSGGGGASGLATTSTTYANRGEFWFLRTSGVTVALGGNNNATGPWGVYDGTNYIFGNSRLASSTDTITWIVRTISYALGTIYSITYGSDKTEKYVICGTDGAGDKIGSSTDSIVWVARTTGIPTSATTCSLTYGNGFYVMLSQNNGIIASTDGIVWQLRTSASFAAPYHSFYAGGYYIVGGQSNHIRVSTNTINWTLRTSALSKAGEYINSITYGNGIYLVGCSNASMLSTSTDTIVWVLRTTSSANVMYGMHYGLHNGNHVYMFNVTGGSTLTSSDGIVWIVRTVIIASAGSSIYGNGIHVRSGSAGQISVSTIPTGNAGSGGGGGATVGSRISRSNISGTTLAVNVGSGGTAGTAGAASTVSWTSPGGNFSITANGGSAGVNTFPSTSNILSGGAGGTISTSNNYLYSSAGTAGGNGGYFESSTNNRQGLSGSDATSATLAYQTTGGGGGASSLFDGQFGTFGGSINYYSNTYQNSKTIPALMNGTSSLSVSGLSYGNGGNGGGAQHGAVVWVLRTSGFGATAYDITYGNGIYILCGNAGRLSTSTDTITWIARTSGFGTSNINATLYANGNYLIFGSGGAISISTDSIRWTARTNAGASTGVLGNPNNGGPSAIYANNLYFICGSNERLLISTDTIVWTLRTTSMAGLDVRSISYGSDKTEKYVICGSSSNIRSSTDTINWTLRTLGQAATTLSSLQYFNQNYYTFTQGGLFVTSTDAIVWTLLRNTGVQCTSAISSNSLIVGGSLGWITTSTNGISWVLRTSGVSTNAFSCAYGNGLFLASYGPVAEVIVADSNINGGNGGSGIRGGGGGGGGYSLTSNTAGIGGTGGDGYVRISWQ